MYSHPEIKMFYTQPEGSYSFLHTHTHTPFSPEVPMHMQANLFWLLSQFISVATKQPITLIKKAPATQSCPVNKPHWIAQNKWALACNQYREFPPRSVITATQVQLKRMLCMELQGHYQSRQTQLEKVPLCEAQLKNRPVCVHLSTDCLLGGKVLNR